MVVVQLWEKVEIKKKELGCNIKVNLDFTNYREFLDKVKRLAQKYEAKSDIKKLNYAVVYNGRKRPYMNVRGWCSRVLEKSGKISEVVFVDYDDCLFRILEEELRYVQEKYNLAPFMVFTTHEQLDPNGEMYGNYICVSISKKKYKEVIEILSELHNCDVSYRLVPQSYRFKTWVLRLSSKGKKRPPEFKCVIGDLNKKYAQDCSQAHLECISKVYPNLPKIKYTNLDGGHKIYLTEYLTASK